MMRCLTRKPNSAIVSDRLTNMDVIPNKPLLHGIRTHHICAMLLLCQRLTTFLAFMQVACIPASSHISAGNNEQDVPQEEHANNGSYAYEFSFVGLPQPLQLQRHCSLQTTWLSHSADPALRLNHTLTAEMHAHVKQGQHGTFKKHSCVSAISC